MAITAHGQSSLLDGLTVGQSDGASVVLSRPFDDRSHALLAVRYDNGYWVKVSDTVYRNATRRFAPEAQDSIWSAKFAKTLTGPLAPWQRVVGHELELVPLRNPAEIKPGESLRVRLMFRGKPLADARVERSDGVTPMKEEDIPRLKTDADGVATISVARAGPVLLAVDHRVSPSETPEIAMADLFNATLWFAVSKP